MARGFETTAVRVTADPLPADGGIGRLFIDAPDSDAAELLAGDLDVVRPKLLQERDRCRVRVELDLGDERQLADVLARIERWLQRIRRHRAIVAVNDRRYVVEAPSTA